MGHLYLGNILFMFHQIHGRIKFREFGAAASNFLLKKSANCCWWNHIITESTLLNVPSKHWKMHSLLRWQQPIATSHCNFGIISCHRLSIRSTCCKRPASIPKNPHMKYLMARLYDWNRYPLAPLGCKAVVYEDGNTRGSWASQGIGRWYLGPSLDHYKWDIYYVPETQSYRISGLTKLCPQHCQLPNMSPHQHLHALTNKLTDGATVANMTTKGKCLLRMLHNQTTAMLAPPQPVGEQRAVNNINQQTRESEQRVIDESPIITIVWE